MAKIKLTKNELKSQKDALKRYVRYLPTLVLKKQQLQMVIRRVEHQEAEKSGQLESLTAELERWVDVFSEQVEFENLLKIESLTTEAGNIAGVDIPVFQGIEFQEAEYSLFSIPLWVDKALEFLKQITTLHVEISVLQEQIKRLGDELRITTQRVNLFEKVKIPETREHIRIIRIYLGDQQTAAVVRGKIAKTNIVKVK